MATGTLAACGGAGSLSSPTPAPNCASLDTLGLDKILSDPIFNGVDKALLKAIFDPTPQIQALYQGYFDQSGRQLQLDNVIRSIPAAGIVIRTPGTYTFGNDIAWTPNDVQCSAITIQ